MSKSEELSEVSVGARNVSESTMNTLRSLKIAPALGSTTEVVKVLSELNEFASCACSTLNAIAKKHEKAKGSAEAWERIHERLVRDIETILSTASEMPVGYKSSMPDLVGLKRTLDSIKALSMTDDNPAPLGIKFRKKKKEKKRIKQACAELDKIEGKLTLRLGAGFRACSRPKSELLRNGGVPEVCPHYIERPEIEDDLEDMFTRSEYWGKETPPPCVIVQGEAGVGKSMVVAKFARGHSILWPFVFWLNIMGRTGPSGNVQTLMEEFYGMVVDNLCAKTSRNARIGVRRSLEDLSSEINALLQTRRCLLVLDGMEDADPAVLHAFLRIHCSIIVTMRTGGVELGKRFVVKELKPLNAIDSELLFWKIAKKSPRANQNQSRDIIRACEGSPAHLSLSGTLFLKNLNQDGSNFEHVKIRKALGQTHKQLARTMDPVSDTIDDLLSTEDKVPSEGPKFSAQRFQSCLKASLATLSPENAERYLMMGVLPPGYRADLDMLRNLWELDDLDSTERTARLFEGLFLAEAHPLEDCEMAWGLPGGCLDAIRHYLQTRRDLNDKAINLQNQYLSRFDTFRRLFAANRFSLMCLWEEVGGKACIPGFVSANLENLKGDMNATHEVTQFLLDWGLLGDAEQLNRNMFCYCLEGSVDQAILWHNLGTVLCERETFEEANSLYVRALSAQEAAPRGVDRGDLADSLYNFATVLASQQMYSKAEDLAMRALFVYRKVLGVSHPKIGMCMNVVGTLFQKQRKYEEAEHMQQNAYALLSNVMTEYHIEVVKVQGSLGMLFKELKRHEEAEKLFRSCIPSLERVLGVNHADVADAKYNLGELWQRMGRIDDATEMYRSALGIRKAIFGVESPVVAQTSETLGKCLEAGGKFDEAQKFYSGALSVMVDSSRAKIQES